MEIPKDAVKNVAITRRDNISAAQVELLRSVFIRYKAQHWDDTTRFHYTRLLVEHFQQKLNNQQIYYQFFKFKNEVIFRLSIGTNLLNITIDMCSMENKFINHGILVILASVYKKFTVDADKQLLPIKMHEFLHRCYDACFCGSVEEMNRVFLPDDVVRVSYFVHFIKLHLLPFYCNGWQKFSDITNSVAKSSCKADQILNEIEFELNVDRFTMIQNNPTILNEFIQSTYVKESIADVDSKSLFYFPVGTNINTYPSYIKHAIVNNNKEYLYRLLLDTLELCVWDYYITNLTVNGIEVLHSNENTDNNDEVIGASDNQNDTPDNKWINFSSHMNTSLISLQLQEILYYVCGCSVYTAIESVPSYTIHRSEILHKLRDILCVSESVAESDGLPCRVVQQRQKYRLLYVNDSVFEILLNMEYFIFAPYLNNIVLLAVIGDAFVDYLFSLVERYGFMKRLYDLIYNAFQPHIAGVVCEVSSTDGGVKIMFDNCDNAGHLTQLLCCTFCRHFINTILKDFIVNLKRITSENKDVLKNVSFRIGVLMKSINNSVDCNE